LAGFWGSKKITGGGPDRVYVYDFYNLSHSFHRIVEVDLRKQRLSSAGLILDK
jgi:hypothetical protein